MVIRIVYKEAVQVLGRFELHINNLCLTWWKLKEFLQVCRKETIKALFSVDDHYCSVEESLWMD